MIKEKQEIKRQTANRDLLKFDNRFTNPFSMGIKGSSLDHKTLAIAKLLDEEPEEKPKKPNFCAIAKSSIFARLSEFVPKFQEDTEDLLNDEERLKACRVDEVQLEPVKLTDVLIPK